MTMLRSRPREKRTTPLDVAYLALLILTFTVAGVVIFLLEPDSWFHRNRNAALSLLLGALGVTGVINLAIANAHGKVWMKSGPVYRAEHPGLFATGTSMTVAILIAVVGGVIALLFFLPPL